MNGIFRENVENKKQFVFPYSASNPWGKFLNRKVDRHIMCSHLHVQWNYETFSFYNGVFI